VALIYMLLSAAVVLPAVFVGSVIIWDQKIVPITSSLVAMMTRYRSREHVASPPG
jgi:hypothetical protein